MKTPELTRITPVKGTFPAGIGGTIGYSVRGISHPDMAGRLNDESFRLVLRLDIDDMAAQGAGCGDFVSSWLVPGDTGKRTMITVAGRWTMMPDFKLLLRIARWKHNHSSEEALTREDFREAYGPAFGDHFHSKWMSCERSIGEMVGYFGNDTDNGQQFLGLVMKRVCQYEKRLNEKQ